MLATPNPLDPVLDFDVILALARQHLPSAKAVTAVDESGNQARAYVIDEEFVFKTQRPHRLGPKTTASWPVASYASLEKETFHLQQLEGYAPEINVPRVLGYGQRDGVEYLLMTRIRGVVVRDPTRTSKVAVPDAVVDGQARVAMLRDLGALLRRVHSLPVAPLRESGLFPGDQGPADTRQRIENLLGTVLQAAGSGQLAWNLEVTPEALASKLLDALGGSIDEPVAVHSNPGPEHVFVDPASLRLVGVIDFADAYFSHPAFDMRRWVSGADRRALLAGYAAEGPLSSAFYAECRAIMTAVLMYTAASRPERRNQALDGVRSLLAESEAAGG